MLEGLLESPPRVAAKRPLASAGLRWIGVNLERFSPLGGADEREDAEKHKAFVELALLVWRLRREAGLRDAPEIEQLLDFVATIFELEPFRERLVRLDDLFVTYALLYALLREAGRVDDEAEHRRMQRIVDGSTVQVSERPAHRVLEVRQILDAASLHHSMPSYRALAARTILARPITLVRATEHDAYSITHDVFYLSDWGCSTVRGLSAAAMQRTKRTVDDLLGMYVYARHWDLVGELLLASRFLDDTSSEFYRCGWCGLEQAQLDDGAVPGPAYDPAEADARAGDERGAYTFKECYHPTLVAAFVGTLCPPPAGMVDA